MKLWESVIEISSAKAYCAVVFVRVVCSYGVEVNLWAGKCRVAPMKDLSIPRLELLACVLLSKLVVSVINAVRLEVQVRNVFCWTDSQIAVWWIKQSNKRWNVWVQNRVEIIRNNTSSVHWFHVPSSQNPAYISTRSIPLHAIDHLSWQKAPSFLLQGVEHWPSQDFILLSPEEMTREAISESTVMGVNPRPGEIGEAMNCTKFSSLDKLLRVKSYVSRFISNVKFRIGKSEVILNDELSTDEINASRITWLKYEQRFLVAESKFDKLKSSLKLFCGKDSIWRLKTRLNQLITFSYSNKFPILLRSQSHFTMLVILKIHERTWHSGVGVTLTNIRELYWIVNG